MATLTGELISETYDSLLKVTDNNTITGIKKRITDGFGNDIPLLLSSTDIEIDGTLILSALTDLAPATKFLSLKADNSVGFRTSSELLSDIGGASSASISGTTGRLSKFTSSGAVGNSILNEIGNAIHLTDGTSSYASFGINNPGIDNDAYIGSTINNDFLIKVNNTEAARFDTALRLRLANIEKATGNTDRFLVSNVGVVKYRTGDELRSDIGAGVGSVTSVGLTMPVAFSVANSPITSAGTLEVSAVGTASQYIRGDGQLATLPTGAGGGSAVNYYLNGSVASSVATYQQMDNSAIIGVGTDFNLTGNGLIAQFLTDLNNPNRLLIPGGAWNLEMFFSVSSSGGNQKFYVDLLKYNGSTFSLIASTSTNPEEITGGTATDLYLTSLAVPETVLLTTDRLAIRVYIVDNAVGRTVTLHTEDNNLCLVTTTFAGGISALNGLTANTQYFAVGTSGTDFNISSLLDTHTFNIPSASDTARGLITTGAQTIAGAKTFSVDAIVNGVNIGRGGGNIATNTRVGQNAGLSNTTGFYNSFIGYQSGYYNTQGDHNSFIGAYAGHYNTFGYSNSFIGAYAGHSNTTGYNNSSIGYLAGYANTSGNNNLFIGQDSGGRNTTGSYNLFIGIEAGNFISNGGNNVTPSNSIFLGYDTKALNNNETNQIVIGHSGRGLGSNTTVLGNSSTVFGRFWGNLLLGDSSNTGQALQITGNAKITGTITNGTYTYTLPSATGTLALTSALTAYVPYTGATGPVNLGAYDLTVNTLTVGRGGGAILSNTAFGINALFTNTTGQLNTAIGYNSGYLTNAGASNQTSQTSVYIGADTRASASGNTNEIVIGCNGRGGGSNSATLGNSSIATTILHGNTSIGYTTNPNLYKLDVNGSGRFAGDVVIGGSITSLSNSDELSFFAGTTVADNRSRIELYGPTHATLPNQTFIRGSQITFTSSSAATEYMRFASTGAATFSSSVQTNRIKLVESTYGTNYTIYTGVDNTNSIGIYNETSGVYNLKIASTGAATFSSSVNVGGVSANTDFRIYRTVDPTAFFHISAPGGDPLTSILGIGNTNVMSLNASGNVGIGTTTPGSSPNNTLLGFALGSNIQARTAVPQIAISSNIDGDWFSATYKVSNFATQMVLDSNGGTIAFRNAISGTAGSPITFNTPFFIGNNGNIGMGTISPSYQLQLSTDSAAKPTSALWTIASDSRIKENINPYTKGLTDLLKINPVTYDYNGLGGFKKGKGGVGIIAQEIMNILPDSVNAVKGKLKETDKEEIDILNFNGHELTYVLINAIKELNEKIIQLENK